MVDWIDGILAVGSCFDVITPVINELQGYNRYAYETRDYQAAVAYCEHLRKQGIKARVAGDPLVGYMVLTK